MASNSDLALARAIAKRLTGKFWQVTLGEWWVVVEGECIDKLVIWTNDPFGIHFTPQSTKPDFARLRWRVTQELQEAGLICEDGTWSEAAARSEFGIPIGANC